MTHPATHFRRSSMQPARFWTGGIAALLLVTGCVTPWERSALMNDKRAEIGSVQGPTERNLRGILRERRREESEAGNLLQPIAGADEYRAAEELYEGKDYVAAEKAFKKVAKQFKKSEIREDALFMEAEAAYAQERYAKAHDLYARVLKDFPTTRHLDQISSRLFKISMLWLDHPQVADMDEIQQVNHENYGNKLPPKADAKQAKRYILVPNFTDKKRPVFDPQGNAITALRSIWTNDPTGPLADDALMLAASYYSRAGDFVEADRHFTMLREQFPNSPHVQKAFELGSHVKLMSYQGSPYDGKMLHDAEQLKQATLRLYPDLEGRERMESELRKIEAAKADRLWAMALFYEGKGNKKAAAIYCHMLAKEYPGSPYEKKATRKLDQLGPGYANGRALQSPYPDPPKTLWTSIVPPDDHGGIPGPPPAALLNPSQQPKPYGSRLALIKPKPEKPRKSSVKSDVVQASGTKKSDPKPKRPADEPRTLPNDDDLGAKPAPKGVSRLNAPPADSEDDAGHTRL